MIRSNLCRRRLLVLFSVMALMTGFGSAQTLLFGQSDGLADDPLYTLDLPTDVLTEQLMDGTVRGATWDPDEERFLITYSLGGGPPTQLWEYRTGDLSFTLLGTMEVGKDTLSISGLAYSGGSLYGVHPVDSPAGVEGLYRIDLGTLEGTLVVAHDLTDPKVPDNNAGISGIDADPTTGTIYGTDDTNQQVVRYDLGGGSIIPVVDYPGKSFDIDGLAACGNDRIYLISDGNGGDGDPAQDHYVYNLAEAAYEDSIANPMTILDPFSEADAGGACIPAPPGVLEIPVQGPAGRLILVLALLGAAAWAFRWR